MIPGNWKERLIEQTKKEIMQEARDKVSVRYNQQYSLSPDLPKSNSRLSKLEQLQQSYEFLQKELKLRKESPVRTVNKTPTPEISQSFPNSQNESLEGLKLHLNQMQVLQKRAKDILMKERLANLASIPESSSLTEKALKKKRLEKVEMKIPVYVPLKSIRKQKNLPPATFNTVLANGEVMPVYMVGDPTPRYSPLVRVNQTIPNQSSLKNYRDSIDATAHSKKNVSIDSVFYYRIYKNDKNKISHEERAKEPESDLTEPPKQREFRPATPTDLPYAWNFRELEHKVEKVKPKRQWVKERMEHYSENQVKKHFLPKIDPNKSFESLLNKERMLPMKTFKRVKIL